MEQGFTQSDHEAIEEIKQPTEPVEIPQASINDFSRFLTPASEIPKKSYSLEPDMLNGWRPPKKLLLYTQSPFGLTFHNRILDQLVKNLLSPRFKTKYNVVYLGDRPANSYQLHENITNTNKSYLNPYPCDKQPPTTRNVDRPFTGMNIRVTDSLIFDSNFESGNLDVAIRIDETQYDLFMRVDTNTKGHTNWYYFTVKNKAFLGKVRFNICNFQKTKSLYQRGMKPYVYSKLNSEEGWHQAGLQGVYLNQKPRYELEEDDDDEQSILTYNYIYSFSYDFSYEDDETSFAYCIPYTYSQLNDHILQWKSLHTPIFKHQTLWKTLSGLPVPVITITDDSIDSSIKSLVVVCARVHPGQSNSSHMAHGLIKYLCSDDENAKNLRSKVIFKIVPMVNPDGVVAGNYRTSLFGKDLNRTYHQSRKFAFPEVFYFKQLIKEHKKKFRSIQMFIDMHGHSVKKNVFIYGPEYPISDNVYYECRELPRILANLTSMFRFYSCIFKISMYKDTTARAIVNRTIPITNCYTIEASNGFYYDRDSHRELPFTQIAYEEMGMYVAKAIHESLTQNQARAKLAQIRNSQRQHRRKTHKRSESDSPIKKPFDDLNDLKNYYTKDNYDKCSDDNISEGSSDSEPPREDMPEQFFQQLEASFSSEPEPEKIVAAVKPKKDHSALETMLILKNDKQQTRRISLEDKLPPLNLTNKFRLVSMSKEGRKKDQMAYERLLQLSSESSSGLAFIKQPAATSSVPSHSINNLTLALNEPPPLPLKFLSESINYMRRREERYKSENKNSNQDLRNSTNAFQSKLDKIFRNKY